MLAIDTALKRLGGKADGYVACTTAWNDGQRGVAANGTLSCLGGNITDAYLVAEDGKHLPFLRPNNHDEKLAVSSAEKLVFTEQDGTQVTAQQVLETLGERAKYMGYTSVDPKVSKNQPVVVRVQNVWVPLGDGGTRKIAPAHYSYQTRDRANPRNLIVVGTAQGVYVHSDATGVNKLLAHTTDADTVREHWFEAEATDARVGGALFEAPDDDRNPKKAKAVEMGVRGMGPRANCFVVLSVPNKQAPTPLTRSGVSVMANGDDGGAYPPPVYRSLGASHAARVSVDVDSVYGIAKKNTTVAIERPPDEPIVATILVYNTIENGADAVDPTDVASAVGDMEHIYELAAKDGGAVCKLSELEAMLHKLTVAQVAEIRDKLNHDPPTKDPPMKSLVPHKGAMAAVLA